MQYTVSIPDKGNLEDICITCPFLSKYDDLYWCNLTGETLCIDEKGQPVKGIDCPVYHQSQEELQ